MGFKTSSRMKNTRNLTESLTLKFSESAGKLRREGKDLISLGLGEPNFPTPQPIVDATIKALNDGLTKYSSAPGLLELRSLISEEPENVIITPGAKQALFLSLIAILEEGDEVINITPCYVSYEPMINILEPKVKVHNVDLNNDLSVNFEKIKDNINSNTKVILINTPHNPTGKVFSGEELKQISEIAIENNLYVISDEVYSKLTNKHISIATLPGMKKRTFTIDGFSKTYSMPGWRLGYVISPKEFTKKVIKAQQHLNTNTCTFVQKGACAAFSLPENYLENFINQLKENNCILEEVVENNPFLSLVKPEGGMFAFLDISKTNLDSDEFCTELVQKYFVATTPGVAFGKNWNDHVRISLAINTEQFREGIRRLNLFVSEVDNNE